MSPSQPASPKPRLPAAERSVRTFFAGNEARGWVTPAEALAAAGRASYPEKTNQQWLLNRLVGLRRHGLLATERRAGKSISRIFLTPKGREALSRREEESPGQAPGNVKGGGENGVTLEEIAALIKRFERENPSARVAFSLSLRRPE